jgi:capsular exopolysaccharide synthesis family protein
MGEISDALKRARREGAAPAEPARQPEEREPVETTYRDALAQEPPPPPGTEGPPVEIPENGSATGFGRRVLSQPHGPVSEHYRHFAIRLNRSLKEVGGRSVIITSASRAEGKTTTSCNLALALASVAGGRQVALLELDIRRPSISEELAVQARVGVEAVLAGESTLAEACLPTNVPDLDLYIVNRPESEALLRLSSPALAGMLRDLRRRYDLIVVDSPPVLPVPDVPLILSHVDAAVVVARVGVTRRAAFQDMLEILGNEKILGVFLNQSGLPRHSRYYGYDSYGPATAEGGGQEEPAR